MITLIILSFLIGIASGIVSPSLHSLHRRSFQRRAAHQTVRLHIGSAQRRAYGVGDRHRLSGQDMVETPLPDLPPSARALSSRTDSRTTSREPCGHPQQRRLEKRRTQGTLQILATGQHPDARPLLHLLLRDNSCNSRNQPYIPFRYTNSGTAGDLTSILFLGIMASGLPSTGVCESSRTMWR